MANGQNSSAVTAKSPVDSRIDDPNFLLCVALTYIGVPPGIWRTIVRLMLEALNAEYRANLGEVRGSKEFEQAKAALMADSAYNLFKAVIVFLGESRIGLIPVKTALAVKLRVQGLDLLVRAGISMARVTAASQIIRRVNLYLELAWFTGCAAYCGGLAYSNAVIDFSNSAVQALADFTQGVSQATNTVATAVLVRPVVIARATMDPSNWDTTPMGSAALALQLLGKSLWSKLQPDNADAFLANLMKPMSEFGFPMNVIQEIASAMTNTVNARGGFQVTFAPQMLLGLSAIAFVQFLKEWRVLDFTRDPKTVADEAITKQGN